MGGAKYILFVPKKVSTPGVALVEKELKRAKIDSIEKTGHLIMAPLNERTVKAVGKGLSIQASYSDIISPANLRKLPESAQRLGRAWNHCIKAQRRD